MRLLKFYGSSMEDALQKVRASLGEDPLVMGTRSIPSGSELSRLYSGARVEVTAAVEPVPNTGPPRNFGEFVKQRLADGTDPRELAGGAKKARSRPAVQPPAVAAASVDLLTDLGNLKGQLRDLLDQTGPETDIRDQHDLEEFRFLVRQGIEPSILSNSFRRWLDCRTGQGASATAQSDPISFRRWLWSEWTENHLGSDLLAPRTSPGTPAGMICLVGGNGVGKSTTIAKLASNIRQYDKKRVAVLSLDSVRLGANEQWKAYSKLMDVAYYGIVSEANIVSYAEAQENFDWTLVDTPGGMTPGSHSGRMYGSLLAHCPHMRTGLVLDGSSKDQVNREQIRMNAPFSIQGLIFSKLDQTPERGGLLNVTLGGDQKIQSLGTGTRIPEDIEDATADSLWRWVFDCPPQVTPMAGANS